MVVNKYCMRQKSGQSKKFRFGNAKRPALKGWRLIDKEHQVNIIGKQCIVNGN